jgi:zinc protease
MTAPAGVTERTTREGITCVVLANGMRAILAPRPESPVVSVQTWYRVGSREEDRGKTGLAHFLEHLLFKGTETLRKGDIDLVTLRNGGANNADTSQDRTRYYFTFAADRWERALEIEADRMRGSAFDDAEFHAERGPVIEELRRDHDDPWWRLHETLEATAYHVHPYRNPVIGWPEEVMNVPRSDVLAFYDAYYRPNNCTLTIAGAFETDAAIARVVELFGALESVPIPERLVPAEPPQEGERRFELLLDVQVPRIAVAYHTVPVQHADDVVLDVVQVLLSGGKASRLYDRLVRRERMAPYAQAWNDTRRDPGLFQLFAEANGDVEPAALEAALFEEVDRLRDEGPTDVELARAKAILAADTVYRRATSAGVAESLGSYEVLAHDWGLFLDLPGRIEALTADDVRTTMARYFRRANRTVGWALPRPDGAPPPAALPADHVHVEGAGPSTDDRDEPSILGHAPGRRLEIELPVRRTVLANGLRVLLLPRHDLPIVSARMHVDGGHSRERRLGAAVLSGAVLDEGAAGRSGEEIARFLESRGARFSAGAGGAGLRCLKQHFEDCVGVLSDVLTAPDFGKDAIERKRDVLCTQLLAEDDDANVVGRLRLRREIYGDHPLGRRSKASAEALRALDREALAQHHAACFVPRNAILSVVGDFDPDAMEALLTERLGGWADRPLDHPSLPAVSLRDPADMVLIEQDRDQVHVHLGHLGIRRAHPDYHALLLGDLILGSGPGFTDRLSGTLRDEQGLAYSVWARLARSSDLEPGMFHAYVGTSPQEWRRAEAGMRAEIERYVSGPIERREVEDARRYLLGSFVFGFETASVTADQLVQMERLGLGFDYPKRFVETIEAVTVDEVQAAARRHIHPDRLLTTVVGRVS